jgi:hypothetical protein
MTYRKDKVATKFKLATRGAALLIGSLAAACGGSDATSSTDGGTADGGGASGGGSSSGGQGGSSSGSPGGGSGSDGASAADAPRPVDGGKEVGSGTGSSVLAVNLGTAGNYVILAKSGISTVPTSAVTGNLGVSPAAATYVTGFALTADATNVFSMSPQVTGKVYAADYSAPTPSNLTTAVSDMQLAFTDAAGRAAGVTELGAGNIGGMTIAPGVYKWGTGLLIPTNVTLAGSATGVWILQVAQNLTVSSGTRVLLTGGALAKNVFWQIAGAADLGTTSHLEGVVMAQTSVTLHTGASINGRLLAQTAVSIDGSAVVQPAP